MLSFQYTVSALVYSLLDDRIADTMAHGARLHNQVVRFVSAQYSRTPDFMQGPFRLLTLIFDAAPLLTRGRVFHRLDAEQRIAQIDRWRNSRIGPLRDFIRYYEGLAVFGWYAIAEEGADTV